MSDEQLTDAQQSVLYAVYLCTCGDRGHGVPRGTIVLLAQVFSTEELKAMCVRVKAFMNERPQEKSS